MRLDDRVAVFGQGAIGLFVARYCRLSGAALVIAVDPLPLRRSPPRRRRAPLSDPRCR
ncbi:MAG TPA: hypothetical protein VHQ00_03005 [Chloroflexota bacterium]|nr:hypothetical protein [Chloroflexota bacterium]